MGEDRRSPEELMRRLMTAIATLSLGALPIAAQVPARPTPPNPPPQQVAPPAPLTDAQRQQQQAIRERYAKELEAQRAAVQATNEKMRAEIQGTLTPEQRARMPQGGGRGMAMGGGAGDMPMGPPQDDIYARPGGMMRRRAEAMMRTQPRRGGRTIIIMTPKEMRHMMRARGGKRMNAPQPRPQMQRGGGMMGGMQPKAAVPPKPAVKAKKGGGES
jgi:hypothetical protein